MAIVKPENMDFSQQRFSCIIYGSPGTGKTTLALSAPDPILLDFDRGISRVRAQHRKDTSVCSTYEEVLADVNSPAMVNYQTIVIDTGGSFITFLKDWAMRNKKGATLKNGEFNGMKGFAYVKAEFARFTEDIKTRLNKNVIYVFHSVEQSDKDGNPTQRLMCEGSTKNTVWTPCDFGGYVQMIGNQRVICFTPEQEFFAKGCHGITGQRNIPYLAADTPNDFMSRLFAEARENIAREKDVYQGMKDAYELAMSQARSIVENIDDAESANVALKAVRELQHASTSQKESISLLHQKCLSLGLTYKKASDSYIAKE